MSQEKQIADLKVALDVLVKRAADLAASIDASNKAVDTLVQNVALLTTTLNDAVTKLSAALPAPRS